MTKNKFIIDKYSTTIYPYSVYVCKNYTANDINKRFNGLDDLDINDQKDLCISGITDKNNEYCILILLCKITVNHKDKSEQVNVCAHEALHATCDILEEIGQPLSSKYSEAYCYLCGYISQCAYKTLIK